MSNMAVLPLSTAMAHRSFTPINSLFAFHAGAKPRSVQQRIPEMRHRAYSQARMVRRVPLLGHPPATLSQPPQTQRPAEPVLLRLANHGFVAALRTAPTS